MKKLFFMAGIIAMNVYAINPTQGPLQQDPSLCSYGYNQKCYNNSNTPLQPSIRHITVEIPPKYGALAFNSQKGAIGGFINANSKAEAQRKAIERCEQGGKYTPCRIIASVKNGCIAAVTGKSKSGMNKIFRAIEEQGQTEEVALNQCKASGYNSCKIVMPEGCSLPNP